MKKLLLPIGVALLSLAPTLPAQAQVVMNDPLHMGVHIGEFAKHLQQWSTTVQNYQVVKDAKGIASVTKDLTGEVKDLTSQGLDLQREIQADLRKVQSIQDLRLANPQQLFARALAMAGSSSGTSYMPNFQKAQRLRIALENHHPQQDIETVYSVFSRLGDGGNANERMSSTTYQSRREEAAVSGYAYEEMVQKKKIATAFDYYKIADEMTQQSIELNATLKNPGRYAMTEGERMTALNSSNDNMIKAMQLRQEGDRLMAESQQKGPARAAAETVYSDVLVQNSLIQLDRQRRARH
ncbi:hypothetical protein ACFQ48_18635 [Hymenobacter caeli]|uniref:P-type DNA transfer protein VirB5 n=1 Tax=Hymenobacter caeli TaxID=2735894 RepID=A0ABX2FUV0_9BACT|nr:hypothetical protein [Hymenobacter caeli]NRT20965.1 hypothetical protein [Hymenobacter caeli]